MTDIQSREDIELLVAIFYKKLLQDDTLKHFFTEVLQLDLDKHLPVICDFWESILLGNMIYRGNVMHKHIDLHAKSRILPAHFDRWLSHWEKTLAENFAGPRAVEAVKRAKLMAELMKYKGKQSESNNFIQ